MRRVRFFVLTTVIIAAVIGFANTGLVRGDEMPKVLLIGDSIMQGYFAPTQTLLAGKLAAYQPIPGSGETRRALIYIDDWIAQEDWDVIHFNWGLHDVYTQSVNNPGVNSVSIAQYEQNLLALVPKLLASGAKLVWCNTTPSYDSAPAFVEADILAYNAVAKKIMDANGIPINNLHDLTRPLLPGIQRAPGDIHYSVAGSQIFAKQVAASILATGVWGEQPFTGLSHSGAIDPKTKVCRSWQRFFYNDGLSARRLIYRAQVVSGCRRIGRKAGRGCRRSFVSPPRTIRIGNSRNRAE